MSDRTGREVIAAWIALSWAAFGLVCPSAASEIRVTGHDAAAGTLSFSYTPECTDHAIVFGPLADVGTYGYSDEVCSIGATGHYDSFVPGPGSYFFLVVGNDGSGAERSYGTDGDGQQRPAGSGCGFVQDLSGNDNDSDGSPTGCDCDDGSGSRFPGQAEVCDSIDNDCNLVADDGGCVDPGFPPVPAPSDPIGTLHVTVRTGPAADDGADGHFLCLCLSPHAPPATSCPSECVTLDNIGWDDLEPDQVDVFSYDQSELGLEWQDVDRVQILSASGGNDQWAPACLQVSLDGHVIYQQEPMTVKFGNEGTCTVGGGACTTDAKCTGGPCSEVTDWSVQGIDPFNPGVPSPPPGCFPGPGHHGPMIGDVGPDHARLWMRTDVTRRVEYHLARNATELVGAEPVKIDYPPATDDFTHTVLVEGLNPETDYVYRIDVDGTSTGVFPLRTAPPDDAPTQFSFAFGSCTSDDEHAIFEHLRDENPDLLLLIGDNHYADNNHLSALRQFYRWGFEQALRADTLSRIPTLATWDDHDFLENNSDGNFMGRDTTLRAFTEYWANPAYGTAGPDGVYFRQRYGDVEFFVLDGRYHRKTEGHGAVAAGYCESNPGQACYYDCSSCSDAADPGLSSGEGPPASLLTSYVCGGSCASCSGTDTCTNLSMLGDGQLSWLKTALSNSTARFKFVVSGSGWSTESSDDSWGAAAYVQERSDLLGHVADPDAGATAVEGVVLLSGDVHRAALRRIPGVVVRLADGTVLERGYTLPELISSPLARANLPCTTGAEHLMCESDGAFYIRVDVDTTVAGSEQLVATVYGYDDVSGMTSPRKSWTIPLHDLENRELPPVPGDEPAPDLDGDGYADLLVGVPDEDISGNSDAGLFHTLLGSSMGLRGTAPNTWHQNTTEVQGAGGAGDLMGFALAAADFDGDGYADAAAGAPGDSEGAAASGAVNVIHGTRNGIDPEDVPGVLYGDALIFQGALLDGVTVAGAAQAGDEFGRALAVGRFDADGFADLVVGVPGENGAAGWVQVFRGSANGLTAAVQQGWSQDDLTAQTGILSHGGDRHGDALAVGNFDCDANGYDDLAVAAPFDSTDGAGVTQAGLVSVLYANAGGTGLSVTGAQVWHQDSGTVGDASEPSDRFGSALEAGDINGDGCDDLVIGVPDEGRTAGAAAGLAHVLFGSPGGLTDAGTGLDNLLLTPESVIAGTSAASDRFAEAIATGRFNEDGCDDVALGAPGHAGAMGAVYVHYGAGAGCTPPTGRMLTEDDARDGQGASGEGFGQALSAADFNRDGFDDLAVGVPGDEVLQCDGNDQACPAGVADGQPCDSGGGSAGICRGVAPAGSIVVFFGSPTGLTAFSDLTSLVGVERHDQRIHQASFDIGGKAEAGDRLGRTLP